MSTINALLSSFLLPIAIPLARVVCGYLYLLHASSKLFHKPHMEYFDGLKPFSLMWIAGVVELVGGVLLVLGLFTQPVAFILSGQMAVAYFIGHASQGKPLFPILNGGEPAVLLCFMMLMFAAIGGGGCSLDALLFK